MPTRCRFVFRPIRRKTCWDNASRPIHQSFASQRFGFSSRHPKLGITIGCLCPSSLQKFASLLLTSFRKGRRRSLRADYFQRSIVEYEGGPIRKRMEWATSDIRQLVPTARCVEEGRIYAELEVCSGFLFPDLKPHSQVLDEADPRYSNSCADHAPVARTGMGSDNTGIGDGCSPQAPPGEGFVDSPVGEMSSIIRFG
ncbi:hypothetical protein GHT06_013409 [Daphnia sinensis]|uniref:Uncharacterized protein n=1 Tax=Daphnia sinensis TaxID=1820382 RepID=A0AAD5LB25_9CRUS|nr:hypothetical protein GHT06_013409 [Daphnia sinensis]